MFNIWNVLNTVGFYKWGKIAYSNKNYNSIWILHHLIMLMYTCIDVFICYMLQVSTT